ncbi:hypothetical protein BO78DRAFT_378858 [Aspergillus sclerotiicarbonarius CBS 121057]|uniref:Zn(2)-C6 fungal-type domain-containing protein n=1 Tax=Aspergillus sclerotiicarbonarius (strain CBS 121057 / IBT 28362) TaxID=1448318 RepID=A0A319DUZ3_ASPSB|nr:hypothetical protein BO78DRAFT_378858 [Aspergillus sclerotiicarbonarius CBS 121057]
MGKNASRSRHLLPRSAWQVADSPSSPHAITGSCSHDLHYLSRLLSVVLSQSSIHINYKAAYDTFPASEMPPTSSPSRPRAQKRIAVACHRCHSRKVKCNAQSGVSCNGCLASNTPCVLIDSQRGRYIRRAKGIRRRSTHSTIQFTRHAEMFQAPRGEPHVAVTFDQSDVQPSTPPVRADADADSNNRFYLHIADQGVRSTPAPITDEASTLFLGESFSLTYVVNDVLAPFLCKTPAFQKRLHFPIAKGFDPSDQGRHNIVQAQTCLLEKQGIFFLPGGDVLQRLLEVYFRYFHPAFPVIRRSEFLQKCQTNQMSLLVLCGVLMVAATMCSSADLDLAGFTHRHQARETFYRQARALYESDSDPDKINNVVAVFLLSFWWGGPNDQKDSWHWLGVAIGAAQSLGLHRSTSKSHMSSQTAQLWRRIWWSLRIRDALVSGSIGRPQHFSVNDCDVEMLDPQDLEDCEFLTGSEEEHYSSQMARLSTIFSRIVASRYAARHPGDASEKLKLESELDRFRAQIPLELQYQGIDGVTGKGLWPVMLLMAYDFGIILLCRQPRSIRDEKEKLWGNHQKAMAAANEATRLMEDILAASMGNVCQIHTIPALFNSLAMHVFSMCTSGNFGRDLAEIRAQVCMLGLTSLQESWPVSGWILKLFMDIMERLKNITRCQNSQLDQGAEPDAVIPTRRSSQGRDMHPQTSTPSTGQEVTLTSTETSSIAVSLDPAFADGSEVCPNLFVLDDLFQDPSLEQTSFFDLLRLPSWDLL